MQPLALAASSALLLLLLLGLPVTAAAGGPSPATPAVEEEGVAPLPAAACPGCTQWGEDDELHHDECPLLQVPLQLRQNGSALGKDIGTPLVKGVVAVLSTGCSFAVFAGICYATRGKFCEHIWGNGFFTQSVPVFSEMAIKTVKATEISYALVTYLGVCPAMATWLAASFMADVVVGTGLSKPGLFWVAVNSQICTPLVNCFVSLLPGVQGHAKCEAPSLWKALSDPRCLGDSPGWWQSNASGQMLLGQQGCTGVNTKPTADCIQTAVDDQFHNHMYKWMCPAPDKTKCAPDLQCAPFIVGSDSWKMCCSNVASNGNCADADGNEQSTGPLLNHRFPCPQEEADSSSFSPTCDKMTGMGPEARCGIVSGIYPFPGEKVWYGCCRYGVRDGHCVVGTMGSCAVSPGNYYVDDSSGSIKNRYCQQPDQGAGVVLACLRNSPNNATDYRCCRWGDTKDYCEGAENH